MKRLFGIFWTVLSLSLVKSAIQKNLEDESLFRSSDVDADGTIDLEEFSSKLNGFECKEELENSKAFEKVSKAADVDLGIQFADLEAQLLSCLDGLETTEDVCDWFEFSVRTSRSYCSELKKKNVIGKDLLLLLEDKDQSTEILQEIGVSSILDQKRILKAVAKRFFGVSTLPAFEIISQKINSMTSDEEINLIIEVSSSSTQQPHHFFMLSQSKQTGEISRNEFILKDLSLSLTLQPLFFCDSEDMKLEVWNEFGKSEAPLVEIETEQSTFCNRKLNFPNHNVLDRFTREFVAEWVHHGLNLGPKYAQIFLSHWITGADFDHFLESPEDLETDLGIIDSSVQQRVLDGINCVLLNVVKPPMTPELEIQERDFSFIEVTWSDPSLISNAEKFLLYRYLIFHNEVDTFTQESSGKDLIGNSVSDLHSTSSWRLIYAGGRSSFVDNEHLIKNHLLTLAVDPEENSTEDISLTVVYKLISWNSVGKSEPSFSENLSLSLQQTSAFHGASFSRFWSDPQSCSSAFEDVDIVVPHEEVEVFQETDSFLWSVVKAMGSFVLSTVINAAHLVLNGVVTLVITFLAVKHRAVVSFIISLLERFGFNSLAKKLRPFSDIKPKKKQKVPLETRPTLELPQNLQPQKSGRNRSFLRSISSQQMRLEDSQSTSNDRLESRSHPLLHHEANTSSDSLMIGSYVGPKKRSKNLWKRLRKVVMSRKRSNKSRCYICGKSTLFKHLCGGCNRIVCDKHTFFKNHSRFYDCEVYSKCRCVLCKR